MLNDDAIQPTTACLQGSIAVVAAGVGLTIASQVSTILVEVSSAKVQYDLGVAYSNRTLREQIPALLVTHRVQ